MDRTFTLLLKYEDIIVDEIDLFADAFGFDKELNELFRDIHINHYEPDDELVLRIIADL